MVGSASHRIGASMSAGAATDHGFLYTTASRMDSFRVRSVISRGEIDEDAKKPSIDDFDAEISIFKVQHHVCILLMIKSLQI